MAEHSTISTGSLISTTTLTSALEATALGDTGAFAELYAELSPRIFGLALRIVRNPALAEEVTQEVFTEIWRTASSYDSARGSGLSWVMTMAHHRAVDKVRRESASRRRDDLYALRTGQTPFDETATAGNASLESRAVRLALAALSPQHREALELAYFGGLTHTELALRLQLPLGTAKSRIRAALLQMRDALPHLAPEVA